MSSRIVLALLAMLTALALAAPALAVPASVTSANWPNCDVLSVPQSVDELGNAPAFPSGELIASSDVGTELTTCLGDDALVLNTLVSITNLTSTAFRDVWYVADFETTLANADGLVNDQRAFRIDSSITDPYGANHPLVSESIAANDIFEPGETWEFIIVDYANTLAFSASAFASAGAVGSVAAPKPDLSSGSIIAMIPEPTTALLLTFGLAGLAALQRSRGA
jgi:hypothetical protein